MNRRGFIGLLGGAALASVPAIELIVPAKKIFLPPRGGWHSLARCVEQYDIHMDSVVRRYSIRVGLEQFDVHARITGQELFGGQAEHVERRSLDMLAEIVREKSGRVIALRSGPVITTYSTQAMHMGQYTA